MEINNIKRDFPLLENENITYLDSGATTQKPIQVINAVEEFYKRYNANPHRGAYSLSVEATEQYENTRTKIAKFINAKHREEIIFSKNATESLNLIAYSYGLDNLKKDDEVVISIMEHHSNLVPWQKMTKQTGSKLNYMYINENYEIPDEEIENKITDKTKIVGITHVSNVLGTINNVKKVIKYAHKKGAIVIVDASQSIPHMKIDVQDLDADFLVFSGHKMLAPLGIGVLYGKKEILNKMIEDSKEYSPYAKINLRQDKLLWVAREYQKQGIYYIEIADTHLGEKGMKAISLLEDLHGIMPQIEKETGVKIRFLVAIRRIPLTIIKDAKINSNYLRENLNVLKAVSKSPYVVGSDFIGEEINDISELKPAIEEIVQYVCNEDNGYTVRIHAGENDSLRDNVQKSIECVKQSLKPGQKMPRVRIGHGLYTTKLDSEKGRKLMQEIKDSGAVLEFQLTSNVRLNNLTTLKNHPIKKYLENGIKCVQGTDGCGFYGTDTVDEQLAIQNLLGLSNEDFLKMRKVEDEIIEHENKYFEEKSKKFNEFLAGRTIREAILDLEEKIEEENKNNTIELRVNHNIEAESILDYKIKELPLDRIPIIIAGGSFNAKNRETKVTEEGLNILEDLIKKIDNKKVYFVVGHKVEGYEKAIIDILNKLNKDFEIYAIVPKMISKEVGEKLLNDNINGVRISTENEEFGIYKSFNYEIFERRNSIVIAFDGNSPVSNLVQEAKNGKGKSKIYVNKDNYNLRVKARSLQGYVDTFNLVCNDDIVDKILNDNPEIV